MHKTRLDLINTPQVADLMDSTHPLIAVYRTLLLCRVSIAAINHRFHVLIHRQLKSHFLLLLPDGFQRAILYSFASSTTRH